MYMRFIFLRMVSFNGLLLGIEWYWEKHLVALKQLERYTEERDIVWWWAIWLEEKSSRPLSDYNYMAYLSSILHTIDVNWAYIAIQCIYFIRTQNAKFNEYTFVKLLLFKAWNIIFIIGNICTLLSSNRYL